MTKLVAANLITLLCFIGISNGYFKEKPAFLKTCYLKDPDFKTCSTTAVQEIFRKVAGGVKEIGLKPIDPLFLDKINILQGGGPVSVNASLDNVTVTGFGTTEVIESRVNPKNYEFYSLIKVPKLKIEGIYNLRGRILLVPLVGHGFCWFEPSDLEIEMRSDVTLVKKDDHKFFNVTKSHVRFNIGGLRLRMDNLFDGIKSLEDSTNAYLNANWRPVSESLRPILSRTIEDILVVILRQLFFNLPAEYYIGDVKEI